MSAPTPLRQIERITWSGSGAPYETETIVIGVETCPYRLVKDHRGLVVRISDDPTVGQPCTYPVEVRRSIDYERDDTVSERVWKLGCGYCFKRLLGDDEAVAE